jgi:hypothetical protein
MQRILWFVASVFALLAAPLHAEDVAGIYDGSQMELAARLELNADGRFAYFLSYGAVDEVAQGQWHEIDGGIVLDSDPVTAPAFEQVGTAAGEPGAVSIYLDVPDGLPIQLFSAFVTLSNGASFVADFGVDGLVIPFEEGEKVSSVALALPMFEVRSGDLPVADGEHDLTFRFLPNDFGVFDFDNAFLPRRDGAFLLQRFDRMLRFRREEP